MKIKSSLSNFNTQSSLQITDSWRPKAGANQLTMWLSPSWGMQENSGSGKRQENNRSWSPGGKPQPKPTPQGEGRVWGLESCSDLCAGSPQVAVFSLCLKLQQDRARCEKAASLSKTPRMGAERSSPLTDQPAVHLPPRGSRAREHFPHRTLEPKGWFLRVCLDRGLNLGVSGPHSDQPSYPARATCTLVHNSLQGSRLPTGNVRPRGRNPWARSIYF